MFFARLQAYVPTSAITTQAACDALLDWDVCHDTVNNDAVCVLEPFDCPTTHGTRYSAIASNFSDCEAFIDTHCLENEDWIRCVDTDTDVVTCEQATSSCSGSLHLMSAQDETLTKLFDTKCQCGNYTVSLSLICVV
jgi:hypothetical protein